MLIPSEIVWAIDREGEPVSYVLARQDDTAFALAYAGPQPLA